MKFFILMAVMILLTACGFAPRSIKDVPPQLRQLTLEASNPYDPLCVQLERTLRSVHIQVNTSDRTAPLILRILHNQWQTNIPDILNSGYATTYSYNLTVIYALQNHAGRNIIPPKTISVTRSLIQNANQVYTPDATDLMKREITRTAVILIYHDLMATAHKMGEHP